MSDSQPGTPDPEGDGFREDGRLSRRAAAVVILGLSASLWALLAFGLYWL